MKPTRWIILFIILVPCLGGDLKQADKGELSQTYKKGQEVFLLKPYLEGDWKGLHVYKIQSDAPPVFEPSWRDVVNPESRLLRGDKVSIESVKVAKDHLEIRVKTIERKTANPTSSQRFWGTALFGLAGMAAGQGAYNLHPQAKLRFFGDSSEEIKALVTQYFSGDPPKTELLPGMSPDEVREILGDPSQVFVFGEKKTFKYPHMEAIFSNEKLENVIFQQVGNTPK